MAKDISELDQAAQRLGVAWQKATNYYNTFALDLIRIRKEFAANAYGPEWTFAMWLGQKVGLIEDRVIKQLQNFHSTLAAYERDAVADAAQELARRKATDKLAAEQERLALLKQQQTLRAERRALLDKAKKDKELAREAARKEAEEKKQQAQAARDAAAQKSREEKRKAVRSTAAKEAHTRKKAALAERVKQAEAISQADLDQLATAIRDGMERARQGRQAWIEGTMQQAIALAAAKARFPAVAEFSAWLELRELRYTPNERAALINMGLYPEQARQVLETTERHSLELIWYREVLPLLGDSQVTSARNLTFNRESHLKIVQ